MSENTVVNFLGAEPESLNLEDTWALRLTCYFPRWVVLEIPMYILESLQTRTSNCFPTLRLLPLFWLCGAELCKMP